MTHINIEVISNGLIVELYHDYGPAKLDKTVFCKDWKEVIKTVEEWREAEDNAEKGDALRITQTEN